MSAKQLSEIFKLNPQAGFVFGDAGYALRASHRAGLLGDQGGFFEVESSREIGRDHFRTVEIMGDDVVFYGCHARRFHSRASFLAGAMSLPCELCCGLRNQLRL
jgi:hypothetical protein